MENPNLEQNYWSRTAEGAYRIGHNSIQFLKICYDDRSYQENIVYYNKMESVLKYLNFLMVKIMLK